MPVERIKIKSQRKLIWGPLKRLPPERPFLTWDVEAKPARPNEPINTAWLGAGLYDGTGKPQIYEDRDEFFRELLSPKYADHWCYAHNASGYDFNFLLEFLCRMKIEWTGYRTGQRIFIETCGREFFDSMAILKGSLASIGDELGLTVRKQKVEPDFYEKIEHHWKEGRAKEYLGDDLLTLHEAIQVTRENFANLGGILQPTIASTSMTLFRSRYMDCSIEALPPHDQTPELWRRAYLGGRVEVFKREMGEGNSWDINSSYPASMIDPRGIPCEFEGLFKDNAIPDSPAICQAIVDIPADERHPPLPIVGNDSRLYFPTGQRSGWFTSEELTYCAEKYGRASVRVTESHHFKPRPLFDAYVKDLYGIKGKKGVLGYVAKLALNSLYGKTGMRREREQLVAGARWHGWPWDDKAALAMFERRGEVPHKRVISQEDYIFAIPSQANHAAYVMPQIAATVTARGRLRLQALLDKAGDRSCYCDTDSIYAEAPRDFFLSSKDLGALKIELEIAKGIFAAPKVYWIQERDGKTKGKAKGVSYKDANEVLRFINGEAIRVRRMLGIFESRRRTRVKVGDRWVTKKPGELFSEWQEKRAKHFAMRRDAYGPLSISKMKRTGLLDGGGVLIDKFTSAKAAYLLLIDDEHRVNFVASDALFWKWKENGGPRPAPYQGGQLDSFNIELGLSGRNRLVSLAEGWERWIGRARSWLDDRVTMGIRLLYETVGNFALPDSLVELYAQQKIDDAENE